ncbi:MAG: substrate-binding domain-containing protein [Chloroflexi bacterium]|nr:substrate-binding domain-containing protein [Chloroflexota bacterium]MBV9602410.1 substrate-binding domain-containing protein [Chloroflexota bacterium]
MFGTLSRWVCVRGLVLAVALAAGATAPVDANAPLANTSTDAQSLSGKLTIAGSSALQPLVDQAAKSYQAANQNVQITVSAGGSGAGRSGVCQGSLDIGMSDVPLTDQERTNLNCADAVQTAVAIDAFAVAANTKGPASLQSLTKEQMQGIFTGQITNWSAIGGDNQQVVLINRLKGSGTRQNMANYLFDGDDTRFGVGASEEDNSQTVVNTVSQTPGAVSYLGLAFLNNPQLVTIGIAQSDGSVLMPTKDTVATGQWPIGGPGLAITKGQGTELANSFISYMISPAFESDPIWDALGFVVPANPSIGNPTGQ